METENPEISQDGVSSERIGGMQIVAGALIAGVIVFAAVAVFLNLEKAAGDPIMAYIGAGTTVMLVVMHFVVPIVMAAGAMQQLQHKRESMGGDLPTEEILNLYQTQMIVSLAMLESAAFVNLIMYHISVQWWSLVIVGFLLLAMAMRFPTRFKVESWLETKQHELEMGR